MSAHLEFDFHDDGTVTMTHRPSKEASEMTRSSYGPFVASKAALVKVLAGDSNAVTHRILIADEKTMQSIQDAVCPSRPVENGLVTLFLNWWGIG